MVSVPNTVSGGGLAVIALLIIAGDLPSLEAVPVQDALLNLGTVDGSTFYALLDTGRYGLELVENVTWEQADNHCQLHNLRLPSLEKKTHFEFFNQLIVNPGLPENILFFWLNNRGADMCRAAIVTRDGFRIDMEVCSRLALLVICEGDA